MNKTNIIGPLPVAQPGKPMQPSAHSATSRIKWAVAFEAEPLRQCFALPLPGLRHPASASLSLASCWPRPQQFLPVSATGGGRRRCSYRGEALAAGRSLLDTPEAPLLGELAGASPTERLDGRRTARRSISLPVIEVINFHSTPFYHTFPPATRLNGQKTAKMGKKVEKMRSNHSAAAPQSHKTLGKKRQNLQKYHYSLDVV